MALKDWKIDYNSEDEIIYYKMDGQIIVITAKHFMDKDHKWIYELHPKGDYEYFSSKSKASKHAKAYMRSH